MLIGVVGKANVGKSTFFKAATLADVEIANYPFTTIDKNQGVGFVKVSCADKEFKVECRPRFGYCIKGNRFVPLEMIDVAGLVPEAHLGKGRGNEFLDDLRQADLLIHLIDISGGTNEQGEPITPLSYDPEKDVRFLEVEIDMWFFGLLKKSWERFAKQVKQEKKEIEKEIAKQFSGLKINEDMVKWVFDKLKFDKDAASWKEEELKRFATELRKISKPMLIAANKIDFPGSDDNLKRLQKEFPDYLIIGCSAESEVALREASKHGLIKYIPGEDNFETVDEKKLNERQKRALDFIKRNVLEKYRTTGVQDVLNRAVFELLGYIAVYPVATNKLTDKDKNILPDCFLVPKATTASEFAFRIHTDIGKNFIKAIDLKTKKVIGKESPLKDGDVIEIMTLK